MKGKTGEEGVGRERWEKSEKRGGFNTVQPVIQAVTPELRPTAVGNSTRAVDEKEKTKWEMRAEWRN